MVAPGRSRGRGQSGGIPSAKRRIYALQVVVDVNGCGLMADDNEQSKVKILRGTGKTRRRAAGDVMVYSKQIELATRIIS